MASRVFAAVIKSFPLAQAPRGGTAGEMIMAGVTIQTDFSDQRRRWGGAVDPGLIIIPNTLFRYQHLLQLDTVDIVLIINIVDFWDEDEGLPYPRLSVLSDRIYRHRRTVERSISKLTKLGYVQRLPSELHRGQTIRRFDLSGLIARLQELSCEASPTSRGRRARA